MAKARIDLDIKMILTSTKTRSQPNARQLQLSKKSFVICFRDGFLIKSFFSVADIGRIKY